MKLSWEQIFTLEKEGKDFNNYKDGAPLLMLIHRALTNPAKIMQIHWRSLSDCLGVSESVFSKTHRQGWNYDGDTEKLQALFREAVPLKKDLEDYL